MLTLLALNTTVVAFSLFHLQTKSLLLETTYVFRHQAFQIVGFKGPNISNFHKLEVVVKNCNNIT